MASDSTADSTWEHLVTVTCDLMGRVAEPPSQYSTQEHLKSKLFFSSNAAQLVGAVMLLTTLPHRGKMWSACCATRTLRWRHFFVASAARSIMHYIRFEVLNFPPKKTSG